MKTRKSRGPIWSPRSQKSMLAERDLQIALDKCRIHIAYQERRIAELKKTSAGQTNTVMHGASAAIQQALSRTLTEIAERERELQEFKRKGKSLVEQIAALTLTPKQAAERRRLQSTLAALVVERDCEDEAIDKAIGKLINLLECRARTTAQIVDVAAKLEFAPDVDLDGSRYTALTNVLFQDTLAPCREWLNWFLGQEKEKQEHVIGETWVVIPETLPSSGVFRPRERVMLTKRQAASLPSAETQAHPMSPAEAEASVMPPKPQQADEFPVQGFPVRELIS